jgi:NOL1/NOP2/fmu family ribosome biogenesis protein
VPGFFDVIVADVPCSGEGMFRHPAAVAEWSPQNARLCCERQLRIVMESWPALRPGGILIYSTCTFNPAENEENISWVRDKTGAVPLSVDLPPGSPVVNIPYKGVEGYGFHPGRVKGDGFFIAALQKPGIAGDTDGSSGYKAGRGPEVRISKNATVRPSSRAFDLSRSLASFDRSRVVMYEGRIIALAAEAGLYSYIEKNLPVIKSGTMIGEVKNGVLIPAHDLAMSVKIKEESWPWHTLTLKESLQYLRLEPPDASRMVAGRILMKYRGVPLGFANNLGNRVNNGYPRAWRIRMDSTDDPVEIL